MRVQVNKLKGTLSSIIFELNAKNQERDNLEDQIVQVRSIWLRKSERSFRVLPKFKEGLHS